MDIPFAEIRAWLYDAALPFWATHGVDERYGGFLEELGPNGLGTDVAFKRVRVPCRQTYVFSHAALLGWRQGEALSARGYETLIAHARTGEGTWARLLSRHNEVIDATPVLYDFAFVLHALAWRHRLARDADSLVHAHRTLDFIQANLRAGEGFWPTLPPGPPLLQNPHMHLFEACLSLFEATGDERFLDQAHALFALFRKRLFDRRTLAERFSADWARETAPFEPGHHFEWAWLLGQYQRLTGESCEEDAAGLVAFAERASAPFGLVYDAVDEHAKPISATSRTWPNTERIKGWLALFELTGRDPRPAVAQSCELLFERYLAPNGSWIDRLDANGAAIAGPTPASTFYHLFLAFAEVLRLEPALQSLPAKVG